MAETSAEKLLNLIKGGNQSKPNQSVMDNLNLIFGSSDTDVNQLKGGALEGLLDRIAPKRKPIDPALLTLIASTEMAKQASVPGSTVVGAGTSGILKALGVKIQDDKDLEKSDQTRALTGIKLADALTTKPKTGKPSTIRTGVAKGLNNQPKYDKNGKLLYVFSTFNANGDLLGTFEAPTSDSGTTVNVGKKSKMEEKFGDLTVTNLFGYFDGQGKGQNKQEGVIGKALKASTDLQVLNTIKGLLDKADTGFAQSTINQGKKLLNRIGFDFDETQIGIGENLQSLTSGMVLQSVSQMKGALSDKELSFLQSMQADIGNTKAGNYLILLSAERGIKKNLKWNDFFKKFKEDNNISEFATWNNMGKNVKENIELAQKLQTQYNDFIIKDQKNLYQFLVDDRNKFVERLRDEGKDLNTIRKAVKQKYFFTDNDGRSVDAIKFIKPIFDTTIGMPDE